MSQQYDDLQIRVDMLPAKLKQVANYCIEKCRENFGTHLESGYRWTAQEIVIQHSHGRRAFHTLQDIERLFASCKAVREWRIKEGRTPEQADKEEAQYDEILAVFRRALTDNR